MFQTMQTDSIDFCFVFYELKYLWELYITEVFVRQLLIEVDSGLIKNCLIIIHHTQKVGMLNDDKWLFSNVHQPQDI